VDLHLDDRLLHGRILHGWAAALRPRRFVLVSAGLPGSPREPIFAAAARELDASLLCLDPGGSLVPPAPAPGDFWLTDSAAGARWLVESGAPVERLVLVGLRDPAGHRLAEDLQVDAEPLAVLRALWCRGLLVVQQRFPGESARPLPALLPAAGDAKG